jgi:magnesium transporter
MHNFTKISNNIQQAIIDNPKTPNKKLIWIDIKDASKKEIEYLRKEFQFKLSHLQAASSKATAQRPIIEKNENYLFMILHFPVHDGINILAGEIEFFVGEDYIVTLHNNNIKALNQFFNLSKKDGDSLLSYKLESSSILLFEILEKLMMDCFSLIDLNSIAMEKIEHEIFSAEVSKTAIFKIISLKRNIINARKILQNHKNIIKKLINLEISHNPEEHVKKYYIDLLEHSKRIWENLDNQKDMIEVLSSTNESFLNYRISDIMKTLTIFSVIVFPLTLLAAIFSMRTDNGMPFLETQNSFWIIIAIMMTGCLTMLVYFSKKKWL